jgi:hypothetical protein
MLKSSQTIILHLSLFISHLVNRFIISSSINLDSSQSKAKLVLPLTKVLSFLKSLC